MLINLVLIEMQPSEAFVRGYLPRRVQMLGVVECIDVQTPIGRAGSGTHRRFYWSYGVRCSAAPTRSTGSSSRTWNTPPVASAR